jgi:hypothetical protein
MSKGAIILKSDAGGRVLVPVERQVERKRQAERRSAAYCNPFCFAHAAGVISAI